MKVKERENVALKNILQNLKELKRRGDLNKIKDKRDEYLRLLKNQEPSSLQRLNIIVNKLIKESPTLPLELKTQNLSESKCEENRKAHEIQHDHVDIDNSFVRLISNDAYLNGSSEAANQLERNDFDVFDLFPLMDFQ
jgi:hypothetical protein